MMEWLREWLRESWRFARSKPTLALTAVGIAGALLAMGVLSVRIGMLVDDLHQETQDRIQLACDMSFANGQAILDTASGTEEVPPKVVETYRKNLQKQSNIAIHKFDPEFDCKIPEVPDAPNGKGQEDSRQDEEDVRSAARQEGLLRIG